MTNYDDGDDDRDKNGNKDRNNDNNADSISGYDGPIFDPITVPRSCGGGLGDDDDCAVDTAHYVYMCRTIHILYKEHIKDVP